MHVTTSEIPTEVALVTRVCQEQIVRVLVFPAGMLPEQTVATLQTLLADLGDPTCPHDPPLPPLS